MVAIVVPSAYDTPFQLNNTHIKGCTLLQDSVTGELLSECDQEWTKIRITINDNKHLYNRKDIWNT